MIVNRPSAILNSAHTLADQASFQRLCDRLQLAVSINDDALRALGTLPVREIAASTTRTYTRAGEPNRSVIIVAAGLVARCEAVHRATRQFSAVYLPGDICDPSDVSREANAASLIGLGRSAIIEVDRGQVMHLVVEHPSLAAAFLKESSRTYAIGSKLIANLGRKNAVARVGFLLCEVGVRMEKNGFGSREQFHFPATQEQMADMTGLTSVHVNRMIREMSSSGYIEVAKATVTIRDWRRLASECDFDESYLA